MSKIKKSKVTVRAILLLIVLMSIFLFGCKEEVKTPPVNTSSQETKLKAPTFPLQDIIAEEEYDEWFIQESKNILIENDMEYAAEEWSITVGGSHWYIRNQDRNEEAARQQFFADNPGTTEEEW